MKIVRGNVLLVKILALRVDIGPERNINMKHRYFRIWLTDCVDIDGCRERRTLLTPIV